jgi:hypothetical protein
MREVLGVEHLLDEGEDSSYQTRENSEYEDSSMSRQTLGAKVHSQEGNSPEERLRSLNDILVRKEVRR